MIKYLLYILWNVKVAWMVANVVRSSVIKTGHDYKENETVSFE